MVCVGDDEDIGLFPGLATTRLSLASTPDSSRSSLILGQVESRSVRFQQQRIVKRIMVTEPRGRDKREMKRKEGT